MPFFRYSQAAAWMYSSTADDLSSLCESRTSKLEHVFEAELPAPTSASGGHLKRQYNTLSTCPHRRQKLERQTPTQRSQSLARALKTDRLSYVASCMANAYTTLVALPTAVQQCTAANITPADRTSATRVLCSWVPQAKKQQKLVRQALPPSLLDRWNRTARNELKIATGHRKGSRQARPVYHPYSRV